MSHFKCSRNNKRRKLETVQLIMISKVAQIWCDGAEKHQCRWKHCGLKTLDPCCSRTSWNVKIFVCYTNRTSKISVMQVRIPEYLLHTCLKKYVHIFRITVKRSDRNGLVWLRTEMFMSLCQHSNGYYVFQKSCKISWLEANSQGLPCYMDFKRRRVWKGQERNIHSCFCFH